VPLEDEHFEVWPENWKTVLLFLAIETQWRKEITMTGHLVWHGIRYGEAESAMRMMGYRKDQQVLFKGLMDMERAALPLLNKPRK
jgi:hypothetical protein